MAGTELRPVGLAAFSAGWSAVPDCAAEGRPAIEFTGITNIEVSDKCWEPLLDRNLAITIPHNLKMCREAGQGPKGLKRWVNLGDDLELYCGGRLFVNLVIGGA